MRMFFIGMLAFCSSALFGQPELDQSIEKVKSIIEQYEPCNTSTFCFEYSFQVDKEKRELEIKTVRYNYQGNPAKKVLTEVRICKIPVDKIQSAMLFPGEEQSFIFGASEIRQEINGKQGVTDTMILDFNENFVSKASTFQADFNELIRQMKKP